MKIFIFLIIYLSLFTTSISPAEIVLKSGKVLICDVVTENEFQLKVFWNGVYYRIPKSDIFLINLSKNGKHTIYQLENIELVDGSKLKGAIAEENSERLILKTDIGFITVEKSKIKSRGVNSNLEMPSVYKENNNSPIYLKTGILLLAQLNGRPLYPELKNSYGGGFFLEPTSLIFAGKYQLGIRSEYIISNGNGKFDFFNNTLYGKYDYKFSEFHDYYIIFGAGISYDRYRFSGDTSAGINPLITLDLGWQGLNWFDGKYFLRTGIRLTSIIEMGIFFPQAGFEASIGGNF